MRASVASALALVLASCSYDLSGFELDDAGGVLQVDGGGRCDPFGAPSCGAMVTCSAVYWEDTGFDARCSVIGTGSLDSPCRGPGSCAPSLVCVGASIGTEGTCRGVCIPSAAIACPSGPSGMLACTSATSDPLFTSGGRDAYLCIAPATP